jgi:hypothetical protein
MSKAMQQLQASIILCLAPVLGAVAGSPADAARALETPGTDSLGVGPLVAGLSLLAWALTAWLALVLTLSVGGRLPGSLGRVANVLAVRIAPASVRAIVRSATGLTVAGAVLLGGTAAQADPTQPGVTVTLDWPTAASTPTASTTTVPTTAAVTTARPTLPGRPPFAEHDGPTLGEPSTDGAAHGPTPPPTAAAASAVVVQAGDCLWHLAQTALGPTAVRRHAG